MWTENHKLPVIDGVYSMTEKDQIPQTGIPWQVQNDVTYKEKEKGAMKKQ